MKKMKPNRDVSNELCIMKKLTDSPYILKYHDDFEVYGGKCIITEYCPVSIFITFI